MDMGDLYPLNSYRIGGTTGNAKLGYLRSSDLRRGSQILISVLGDMNVILDPHSSNFPVTFKHSFVDVLAQLRVFQNRFDDETAKVDLLRLVELGKAMR